MVGASHHHGSVRGSLRTLGRWPPFSSPQHWVSLGATCTIPGAGGLPQDEDGNVGSVSYISSDVPTISSDFPTISSDVPTISSDFP